MSGGRSRRKKLVRSKRLSKTDSEVEQENINADASAAAVEADSANTNQEILEQTEASTIAQEAVAAEQAATGSEQETGSSEQPPPLETVSCEPRNDETESAFNTTDEASALSISASKNHEQQLDDLNTEIQLAGMYISPENCTKTQTGFYRYYHFSTSHIIAHYRALVPSPGLTYEVCPVAWVFL